MSEKTVEEIVAACESMTGLPYDGEPVDQLEHALQCAALAREHHGETGARWLAPRVGPRVAWLAEQHVPAKRYLVATDPHYRARLSAVSQRTLSAQGGAMDAAEVEAFRANPDWEQAVALRLIDDLGKVPGLEVPGIDSYRPELGRVVLQVRIHLEDRGVASGR